MAGYNRTTLAGAPALVLEGITVDPSIQGNGTFRQITDVADNGEKLICLRTQSPHMYRALEDFCQTVYPNHNPTPTEYQAILQELAIRMNCTADENGIVRGHYGELFYGEKPTHKKIDPLFDKLGLRADDGDALLVIGVR